MSLCNAPDSFVMKNVLTVATDGSCLKNPGGEIGWAWADSKGRWQANGLPSGTNQNAELLGFLSVLYAFPQSNLHVQLDSQYVLNIATKWMFSWERNGWWRDSKRTKPVTNLPHVKNVYAMMKARKAAGLDTTFEWVKGHSVNALNNVADKEAQAAARRVKSKRGGYADSAANVRSERQNVMLSHVFDK